jgi:tryptophan synthase beta chain
MGDKMKYREFGPFGGAYVSEMLRKPIDELKAAYGKVKKDKKFLKEYKDLLVNYAGRPTAVTELPVISKKLGCRVFLKREDLLHGGAHKTNNVLGQALLAGRMKKRRIVAETGAGQHGVATAMVGAKLGFDVTVYMGAVDMERQQPNVQRMKLFGAEVIPVTAGLATLKEAVSEALRDWSASYEDSYYLLGSVSGPDPYPEIVRDFQKVIGKEARQQIIKRTGRLPDVAMACVGGGSNATGFFHAFLKDKKVKLFAVEAGGHSAKIGENSASLTYGRPGILHGAKTMLLQDAEGQVAHAHSIAAGLDYPGVGPELANYVREGRIGVMTANDEEAVAACKELCRLEGILPALESAHALAALIKHKNKFKGKICFINLSGRGDKDLKTLGEH